MPSSNISTLREIASYDFWFFKVCLYSMEASICLSDPFIEFLMLFLQAVIRRAKRYGLCLRYNNKEKNPEAHKILKRIIALALLPANLIENGLQIVEDLAYQLGDKKGTTNRWKKFFGYYRKEWMTTVTPEGFSVFGALDRTNNCLERYHRDLNQFLLSNPSVNKFFGKYFYEYYVIRTTTKPWYILYYQCQKFFKNFFTCVQIFC